MNGKYRKARKAAFLLTLPIFAGFWAFNPLQALTMTLMLNARHLFYGISMLDKYRGSGWKKFYLIFGLCDETFSINYTAVIPEGVDKGCFYFWVTLLDHFYWFFGTTLGGLFGSLIPFNTEGLDFVMTAMFVVIFLEQWLKEKNHTGALVGIGLSLLCLLAFGADDFIIPSMLAILGSLTLIRQPLTRRLRKEEAAASHESLSSESAGPGPEAALPTKESR